LGGKQQVQSSEEALFCLESALGSSPNYKNAAKELANLLNFQKVRKDVTRQENFLQSQVLYEHVLNLEPGHLRASMNYVRMLKPSMSRGFRRGTGGGYGRGSGSGQEESVVKNTDVWKQKRREEVVEAILQNHSDHVECLCFAAEYFVERNQNTDDIRRGVELAKKACLLTMSRVQSGDGMRELGWDGLLRMINGALTLSARLSHSAEFGSKKMNWRAHKDGSCTPTNLFKPRKNNPGSYTSGGNGGSGGSGSSGRRNKKYSSNVRWGKGLVVPDAEGHHFQKLYWQLEDLLHARIAPEIVRGVSIVPPAVEDCLVLIHSAHHLFRVAGPTEACLHYAETACEMTFSLSKTIKNRPDPFVKKSFISLVFQLEYMLEAIVEACMKIGKRESIYIEIAKKFSKRRKELNELENVSQNH
jgi:hypothetical protein